MAALFYRSMDRCGGSKRLRLAGQGRELSRSGYYHSVGLACFHYRVSGADTLHQMGMAGVTMDNEDLRKLCLGYTEKILNLRLDLLVLQTCLVDKGLISAADLAQATEKIRQESKTALRNIHDAANPDKQN